MYVDERPDDVTGRMEHALRLAIEAEPLEERLRKRRIQQPPMTSYSDWMAKLVDDGVLEESEAETLLEWQDALRAAIDVDDFAPDRLIGPGAGAGPATKKKAQARRKTTPNKASARKAPARKASARKASAKKTSARTASEVSSEEPTDS